MYLRTDQITSGRIKTLFKTLKHNQKEPEVEVKQSNKLDSIIYSQHEDRVLEAGIEATA